MNPASSLPRAKIKKKREKTGGVKVKSFFLCVLRQGRLYTGRGSFERRATMFFSSRAPFLGNLPSLLSCAHIPGDTDYDQNMICSVRVGAVNDALAKPVRSAV